MRGRELEFEDTFEGGELDPGRWLPYYLPHWSGRERAAARYERDFGTVPRFRGGLHAGAVTAGELGDLKQQIVFVGDILNTAARLEEYAKRAGVDLVVSGTLLDRLPLPPGVTATPCGELEIRGKEARVRAYSVRVASGVS